MDGSDLHPKLDFDVIIIGAGISGLNTAYRIQHELPNDSYAILEGRNSMGGTWDLFRYPGIRSDSDLFTFGFSWYPWTSPNPIAEASAIKDYMTDAAVRFGIDQKILYQHKVNVVHWSGTKHRWFLDISHLDKSKTFTARFIVFGTGYYDYRQPLHAEISGVEKFKGMLVHPQFWPQDLDCENKRVVVIGSGATAITIVPKLAETAGKVTLLQRSPSYIMSIPNRTSQKKNFLMRLIPNAASLKLTRFLKLLTSRIFFLFCRAFPGVAERMLRRGTIRQLPADIPYNPHFKPRYKPWDQRLCVCPNGDFYKSLHTGKVEIKTDTIKQVTESGIELSSGEVLHADIIITATGLKLQFAGGIPIFIDGKNYHLHDKFMWKGMMMEDLPNAALVIGYTNISWTLGADVTGIFVCRLLKHLQRKKYSTVIPRVPETMHLKPQKMLDLNSTYISKAENDLPRTANTGPWQPRKNYFWDLISAKYGRIEESLELIP
ncbi:flavin-binding monooxygenase [Penicillium cosmopolitanum]|uniref:Flavin-binding monooxygenase n=1 Tax=Penicillium cosmopolitanum TaxID=1131564 RepID=A0A9W9WCD1_9EURO|nr:flavin-binding monooxygenase [Penicillium cosmopolitanum]KAJ5414821.1 flavin-binding monooxygenase [Penicillium cosmopolitanum]